MSLRIWPDSDSGALSLPISGAATIPLTLQGASGATLLTSGGTYTAIVYERLARTQAASGAVQVTSYSIGGLSIVFTATGTAGLAERKHYFWVVTETSSDRLLMDGPVHAYLPGNWPPSPYRGHHVRSVLSVLT
jgi:hypothetical protein